MSELEKLKEFLKDILLVEVFEMESKNFAVTGNNKRCFPDLDPLNLKEV